MEGRSQMPRQDTVDFLTAFAIGTALGIGATLLLQPSRPTAKQRIVRQLKPYRKRMGKGYSQLRDGVSEGADATGELTGEMISAGRELIDEFRGELGRVISDARHELQDIAEDRAKDARRQMRRARKKIGM